MTTHELHQRLSRETEHFNELYALEAKSGSLLLGEHDKARYLAPPANTIFAREYFYHLLAPLQGKKILEIACGNGLDACIAAHNGAEVYAYDLSEAAVDLTRKRASENGLSDRVFLQVCGDIDQAFTGQEFDAVTGYAALHHLPLNDLASKLHRRLKVGGIAVFAEPVINSRFLNHFRQLIPYRPTEVTEDEKPLDDGVIAELAKPFRRMVRREFECVARIYPLFSNHRRIVRGLFWLDAWLMKIKALRRFASVVVLALYRDE